MNGSDLTMFQVDFIQMDDSCAISPTAFLSLDYIFHCILLENQCAKNIYHDTGGRIGL